MDKTKTALLAIGLLLAVAGSAQASYAQYGVEGNPTSGVTADQLVECEKYGIQKSECNEHNILAARRVWIARDNPTSGSGTPLLSIGGEQTWVFIGTLGAIFGGVAAAFFVKGRRA